MDTSAQLNVTAALTDSPLFPFGFCVLFVLGALGACLNVALLVAVCRTALIDSNLRLLIANVCAASVGLALTGVFKGFINLAFYLLQRRDLYALSPRNCALSEAPFLLFIQAVNIAVLLISVERCQAAKRFVDYGGNKFKLFFKLLLVVSYAVCAALVVVFVFHASKNVPLCMMSLVAPASVQLSFMAAHVSLHFTACCLYVFVMRKSELELRRYAQNQSQLSLQSRVQLHRNVNSSRMLLPATLSHTVGHLVALVGIYVAIFAEQWISQQTVLLLMLYSNYIVPCIPLSLCPIVCLAKNSTLRVAVLRRLTRQGSTEIGLSAAGLAAMRRSSSKSKSDLPEQEQRLHSLEDMWDAKFDELMKDRRPSVKADK